MSDSNDLALDPCGCCEPQLQPAPLYNRPGLPALRYRAGEYGTFLRRMLNKIGAYALPDGPRQGQRPLAALTTRAADDASVAVLDASAVVADVLTFYQERIANEGYLRTATERYSVLELSRAIGYELNPGVAASTYLAFSVEDAPGAPGIAEVPAGTKVKSIPPQGKLPQTFEAGQPITARKEWNAIRPRLTRPQKVWTDTKRLFLQGAATRLREGDRVLIVVTDSSNQTFTTLARVHRVEVQPDSNRTVVDLSDLPSLTYLAESASAPGSLSPEMSIPFNIETVKQYILGKTWWGPDLNTFLTLNKWDASKLTDLLGEYRARNPQTSGKVYAMRASTPFFGNNAPRYSSLPAKDAADAKNKYGPAWNANSTIWWSQSADDYYDEAADVYLDRSLPGVLPGAWLVIENAGGGHKPFVISGVIERSMAAFAMSAKITGLKLRKPGGSLLANTAADKPTNYTIRNATAYLQSESLPLSDAPLTEPLSAGQYTLHLDTLVLGLSIGRPILLTGQRSDAPGLVNSEVLVIKDIIHFGGYTMLAFEGGLRYGYQRETVTLNANIVAATHGETVSEPLGSGDSTHPNQHLTLKKPHLTHVAAPAASGSASTLEVRVNDLRWDQAASLYLLGANDEKYIVRISDEGKATVIFGDGLHGARLPSGENNVTATYRSGIGMDGHVPAGSLTLLPTRPLGIRGVTNPLPASGAADPETMDNARRNAPLTVRTLERIVTLSDYEDFACAFAGIGKSQAVAVWSGERNLVHLTIAAADGGQVDPASSLYENLVAAINLARDPAQSLRVAGFEKMLFNMQSNVVVDKPRYMVKEVFEAIRTALLETFSFEKRAFGQMVTAAEVLALIQGVPGVIAVDLDALYLSTGSALLNTLLPAQIARLENGIIKKAQLLLINPIGFTLTEVKP